MSKYTPGRLVAHGQRITGPIGISVAHCSDGCITGLSGHYSIFEAEAKANARRLVAAWNACEGIETSQLELMVGDLSIENQIKCIASRKPSGKKTAYRIQRDELIQVLKHIKDHHNLVDFDLRGYVVAAIKKAEGA